MKNVKYCYETLCLYDYRGIEERLSAMAAKGWRLEHIGRLWKYRRAEPAKVRYAVTYMSDDCALIAERNGLNKDNIRWVVPHQANMRIIEAVAKRLDLPMEQVMVNIEHYGNTSAATIPLALWDYESKLKKGDNMILTAFGAGFVHGAMYYKWAYDGDGR